MEKIIARFRDSAGQIFVLIWEDFERKAKYWTGKEMRMYFSNYRAGILMN